MNTFLPLPSFRASASVLDYRRLGKQRLEVVAILRSISGLSDGWKNHPAVKMWRGYDTALASYGLAICDEWTSRGYTDHQRERIISIVGQVPPQPPSHLLPWWFGLSAFHRSHRSNLLRKDPQWYGQFGWRERPGLPYVWPEGSRMWAAEVRPSIGLRR